MSVLLDNVARRVGAPAGLTLHRVWAGRWQRSAGAWSWYATDEHGREVLASHYPLRELARCPALQVRHALDDPMAALEVDPA